ncbi:MAG TPA: hypothetical protein VJ111_03145 [Chitinophagaceae bacterium]|nr:hypothetical protein [Chitinophagaceae bacterium]
MKKLLGLLLPVLLLTACDDKDTIQPPSSIHPQMRYTELSDISIKFGQQKSLDIDGDNIKDLLFSTVLVADPIARVDKRRYFVTASFDVFSLTNEQEETPALNAGDTITINNPPGFNWYNASSPVLAEKIIEETGSAHWEGNWKNTNHNFFPVQVRKNDLRYNGWVEVSFKMDSEELVLHRAAIAIDPGKDVKAAQ